MHPLGLNLTELTRHIKRSLGVQFAVDIIILMTWCIWKEMHGCLVEKIHQVDWCLLLFKKEFAFVIH
jgi:hypothetical protein